MKTTLRISMTTTTNLMKMKIDKPYYEDMSRISNSNIGWFLNKGSAYLRDMLDGKQEGITGATLDRGTMIHMYILQPDEFWENYQILDFETPSSKQQLLFAEQLANTLELEPNRAVISAYNTAYSTTNVSDEKVLEKGLKLSEKLSDYITYLKAEKTGKKTISFADLSMLKTIDANLKKHKLANNLLFETVDGDSANNEFHINWDFPKQHHGINLECKSLLDRVVINHFTKKITLIDIKTTVDVNKFDQSMIQYDYARQLAYYWLAVLWYMKNEVGINAFDENYTFETYIVAIQNNGNYQVKVFNITDKQLEDRLETIDSAISDICWHKTNNMWDYSKEYYEGNGAEQLTL